MLNENWQNKTQVRESTKANIANEPNSARFVISFPPQNLFLVETIILSEFSLLDKQFSVIIRAIDDSSEASPYPRHSSRISA